MWRDHLVICGLSEVGARAAELLSAGFRTTDRILVIDRDPTKAETARKLGFSFILGDATSSSSLRVAQVTSAAAVLVCVDDASALPIIRHVHRAAPQTPIKVVLKDRTHQETAMLSGASEVFVLSQLTGSLLADSALGISGSRPRS
jgi:voltage-gated potassium channel Kch